MRSESALRRAVSRQTPVNTPREGVSTPLGRYFECMAARPKNRSRWPSSTTMTWWSGAWPTCSDRTPRLLSPDSAAPRGRQPPGRQRRRVEQTKDASLVAADRGRRHPTQEPEDEEAPRASPVPANNGCRYEPCCSGDGCHGKDQGKQVYRPKPPHDAPPAGRRLQWAACPIQPLSSPRRRRRSSFVTKASIKR